MATELGNQSCFSLCFTGFSAGPSAVVLREQLVSDGNDNRRASNTFILLVVQVGSFRSELGTGIFGVWLTN